MCATILWGETLPMREDVGSSGRKYQGKVECSK
jgi:hypothetical protein